MSFKTKNKKVVAKGSFTTISPVLGTVTMSHLDLGGGRVVNGKLSDSISPCTATITVDAAVDPEGNGSVLTLGKVVLTEDVHWEVAVADTNTTAANLATAIGNLTGYSATAVGAEVSVEVGSGEMNLDFKQVANTANLVLDPTTGTMTNGSPSIEEPEID